MIRSPVPPEDQATVDDLPTLTVTRSLIDVCPRYPAKSVRVAYDDARRRGGTSLDELTRRATGLGRVRGAPAMRRLLATGDLLLESEGERALNRLWRPGDPKPEPQVWVVYRSRRYRLDFAFLDASLCLEYDGREYHERALDRYRDYDRDLALAQVWVARPKGRVRKSVRVGGGRGGRGRRPATSRVRPGAGRRRRRRG